jgi:hypothetical protein
MALKKPPDQKRCKGKHSKWWPTNKWWAALVTVAGTWVTSLITAGAFTKAIAIALVGIVAQMTVAYLVPNNDTSDGVLMSKKEEKEQSSESQVAARIPDLMPT